MGKPRLHLSTQFHRLSVWVIDTSVLVGCYLAYVSCVFKVHLLEFYVRLIIYFHANYINVMLDLCQTGHSYVIELYNNFMCVLFVLFFF